MSRRVPWASWEEWTAVRGWLFSPAADSVQKGLDRVCSQRTVRARPVARQSAIMKLGVRTVVARPVGGSVAVQRATATGSRHNSFPAGDPCQVRRCPEPVSHVVLP